MMIPLCIGLHLTKQLCTQPGLYWTVSASPLQKLGNEDTWINCATFGLAVFFIMMTSREALSSMSEQAVKASIFLPKKRTRLSSTVFGSTRGSTSWRR
ncbi:MAG: hypothetical protein WBF47_22840 [Xanthobacteraceae bacterium]